MKIIYTITKLELKKLFYSPVAWLILIIFFLQTAVTFMGTLEDIQSIYESGRSLESIIHRLFVQAYSGVWNIMLTNVYYYIPLLTMGLLSKEFSSGSIKLLYSSPVKSLQIVLGKYCAMVVYIMLLMFMLILFVFAGDYAIDDFDYSYALTGLIGIFLVCCAYASIGLFISSLTSYQIIAAIGTLAVLALLNLVGDFGQNLPVLKDILYWLSIKNRTDDFLNGLINSRDLIYLLLMILSFLALTTIKLVSLKKSYSIVKQTLSYTLVFGFVIIGIVISSNPKLMFYCDMTATKHQTLSQNSQHIISKMKDLSKITNYVNILDEGALRAIPSRQNEDKQILKQYIRFLPNIEQEYIYYYDSVPGSFYFRMHKGLPLKEIAKKVAKSFDLDFEDVLSPEKIKDYVDLNKTENYWVRKVEYKDKKTYIRHYDDFMFYASEDEITPALKNLIDENPPVIGSLSGNGERNIYSNSDDGYRLSTTHPLNRNALISKGFFFKTLNLDKNKDGLDNIDILMISDPKVPYSSAVINRIFNYIDNGGNLVLACEPESYELLKPIFDYLNIQATSSKVYQSNKDLDNDFVLAQLHGNTTSLSNQFSRILVDTRMSFPTTLGLTYSDTGRFNTKPLVIASPGTSWLLKNEIGQDSISKINFDKPLPLIVSLTRKLEDKEQRIVVSGDADFMNNLEYNRRIVDEMMVNRFFINPLLSWLSYGEYPIDTTKPAREDTTLTVKDKDITMFSFAFYFIIPGLMLAGGSVLLIKRRRK